MIPLPQENGLARIERSFADAIFFDDAPFPATVRAATGASSASRFSVYRNNVMAGLTGALAARYPVVRRLLWDDTFEQVARRYVTSQPPRSPVLHEYGDGLPGFLRSIGQGSTADYVADIADLEAARTRAYHAPDAEPLSRDDLAAVAADRWPQLRLALHPSVVLLHSRFPVVSVWEANVQANDNMIPVWKQECALVARPGLEVEVRRLTAGCYRFLRALRAGETVGAAIAGALADAPELDLAECFAVLISANIVTGLDLAGDPPATHI